MIQRLLLSTVAAYLMLCGPAFGSTLSELGSADPAVREAATRRLLVDERLSMSTVRKWYAEADASEQRHRLLAVARHLFLREMVAAFAPRTKQGALGLVHRGDPSSNGRLEAGVRVLMTLPGFPAHGRIMPGDLIVAVNGRRLPLRGNAEALATNFVRFVQQVGPGQTARLELVRGDTRMTTDVVLSSFDALGTMYEGGSRAISGPYRQRWLALRAELVTGHAEPALAVDLPPVPPGFTAELSGAADDAAEATDAFDQVFQPRVDLRILNLEQIQE